MSDMIERATRACVRAWVVRVNPQSDPEAPWIDKLVDRLSRDAAQDFRAGIRELREPTEAMCAEGEARGVIRGGTDGDDILCIDEAWRAMIDAALAEPEGRP